MIERANQLALLFRQRVLLHRWMTAVGVFTVSSSSKVPSFLPSVLSARPPFSRGCIDSSHVPSMAAMARSHRIWSLGVAVGLFQTTLTAREAPSRVSGIRFVSVMYTQPYIYQTIIGSLDSSRHTCRKKTNSRIVARSSSRRIACAST